MNYRTYRLRKLASVNAENIRPEVIAAIKQDLIGASGVKIPPFMTWLQQDGCTMSVRVTRDDGFWGDTITVDGLSVSDFTKFSRYQGVPAAMQDYLRKYPDLFPQRKNESSVSYSNFSFNLVFP